MDNTPKTFWLDRSDDKKNTNDSVFELVSDATQISSSLLLEVNLDPPIEGYNDMVEMPKLNNAEILHNLKIRFKKNILYTMIGSTLLFVNPYQSCENLYSPSKINDYFQKTPLYDLKLFAPHIFSSASLAYSQMVTNFKNQSVIITGESGAGKTENTKYSIKMLASISRKNHEELNPFQKEECFLEAKIELCNPILEAFGNAKTPQNDNSSRFGKFVKLMFDRSTHIISGAKIEKYLLEKSRVVERTSLDKNFHVFYILIQGAPKTTLERLKLSNKIQDYAYLEENHIKNIDLTQKFQNLLESFKKVGFESNEVEQIMKVLSSILHLGNSSFNDDDFKASGEDRPCKIVSEDPIRAISEMLELEFDELKQHLLYNAIKNPNNLLKCYSNRDSLAKTLYESLFNWIIYKLNINLCVCEQDQKSNLEIGLLDIFGYEDFGQNNSLEQLLINYTNDNLHELFREIVFRDELEDLKKELESEYLENLNFPVPDVNKFIGFLYSVQGNIRTGFLYKIGDYNDAGKLLSFFQKDVLYLDKNYSKKVLPPNTFTIDHSVKKVQYDTRNFILKNKEEKSPEFLTASFLGFDSYRTNIQSQKKSLSLNFCFEMENLMKKLKQTDISFVRCIKPNNSKEPMDFSERLVFTQMKYLGVLETVKMRIAGFPIRLEYSEFCRKYGKVTEKGSQNYKILCQEIISKEQLKQEDVLYGKSKILIKEKGKKILDERIKQRLEIIRNISPNVENLIESHHTKNMLFCFQKIKDFKFPPKQIPQPELKLVLNKSEDITLPPFPDLNKSEDVTLPPPPQLIPAISFCEANNIQLLSSKLNEAEKKNMQLQEKNMQLQEKIMQLQEKNMHLQEKNMQFQQDVHKLKKKNDKLTEKLKFSSGLLQKRNEDLKIIIETPTTEKTRKRGKNPILIEETLPAEKARGREKNHILIEQKNKIPPQIEIPLIKKFLSINILNEIQTFNTNDLEIDLKSPLQIRDFGEIYYGSIHQGEEFCAMRVDLTKINSKEDLRFVIDRELFRLITNPCPNIEQNDYIVINNFGLATDSEKPNEVFCLYKVLPKKSISLEIFINIMRNLNVRIIKHNHLIIHSDKILGEGGFGNVYKGEWGGIEVAVKKYKEITMPEYLIDLIQEIKNLIFLNHPMVNRFFGVSILELNKKKKFYEIYGVMELAESNFNNYMKKDLTLKEKNGIVSQILEGMCFLQSENIIHGDLKPANFLITNGKVSICDLGSCWKMREKNNRTRKSCDFSTPVYSPPEFSNEGEVGLFSDIWSLGVILHKLYCNGFPKPYYDGVKIVKGDSPDEIVDIINLCLRVEGAKRATLKEIINLFQDFEEKIDRKNKWARFWFN